MALLIDTDLLVGLERGDAASHTRVFPGDEERAISVITVSELLHGVHRAQGAVRARRRAFVEHILAGMEAIPITAPVARVHADIWSDLADRGQPIGAHDLWIAATALAHGLGVATRNTEHFDRVPGLRVVAPST
ncbi:MAG TPA: PIN domain-containing protein [Solirubrobacteraceae bacterium]|nr:PIN domain-containing protein [Solirubrobacteraceae bacterium]